MTYFKDLTKKEKKHLREMGMISLREFKKNAEFQAGERIKYPTSPDPCWDCRTIAKKLGLPI